MRVDLYFGFRDQLNYSLGDTIAWRDGRAVERVTRGRTLVERDKVAKLP